MKDTPQDNVNVHLIIEKTDGKMKAKFKPVGSDKETNVTDTEQEDGIIFLHRRLRPAYAC
ncbi:MAG: hypothetical protein JJU34_02645 [Lunatimonas sp.]|uniref:hypothetical protein n=1 Tax=Lunatimonas sp. TaxID=2060141 RepID=UPI00263B61AA|nr:hypothetical protein [Lunatimonas sp.]MCC5936158.1 hypothetical protein [Lunatimonas sp.]